MAKYKSTKKQLHRSDLRSATTAPPRTSPTGRAVLRSTRKIEYPPPGTLWQEAKEEASTPYPHLVL